MSTLNWKSSFGIKSLFFKIIGVICATVSFKGFMIPNHFLDGGINGICILLHEIFHIHISLLILTLNIPFLVIGYYKIGKNFALNSAIALILLAICLFFFDVPVITSDKFLIAIFGGFFIGLAIGFIIKSGGVIDGLEVIADYTTSKSIFSSGEIIMTINTILFLSAGVIFGIETAMYSIITFYTALKVSNYVVEGFEEYTEMTIVSQEYEAVKAVIVKDFGKAISVYKGERGYLPSSFDVKHDCDIIVVVLTRLEIFHIKKAIRSIDPKAFMYLQSINEVTGGVIKQHRHH